MLLVGDGGEGAPGHLQYPQFVHFLALVAAAAFSSRDFPSPTAQTNALLRWLRESAGAKKFADRYGLPLRFALAE